jgi:hypothetical protein
VTRTVDVLSLAISFAFGAFGCSHHALDGASGDLATADQARGDLAAPAGDLAQLCNLGMNSDVTSPKGLLQYGTLGNIDQGNESGCGPPAEAITVFLSSQPGAADVAQALSFVLQRPLQIGVSQTVMVSFGGAQPGSATVILTGSTALADGSGDEAARGSIDSSALGLSGNFVAQHCAALDRSCI